MCFFEKMVFIIWCLVSKINVGLCVSLYCVKWGFFWMVFVFFIIWDIIVVILFDVLIDFFFDMS